MSVLVRSRVRVADEVWIAVALLHREQPARLDFTVEEIVERAKQESIAGAQRPGLYVHVQQHCVANRPPNPGRYRILYETGPGRRRLFRQGDDYHPEREGSKTVPDIGEIPEIYAGLLSWYRGWKARTLKSASMNDPLLSLAGSGKHLWATEHTDAYIGRLRRGWK